MSLLLFGASFTPVSGISQIILHEPDGIRTHIFPVLNWTPRQLGYRLGLCRTNTTRNAGSRTWSSLTPSVPRRHSCCFSLSSFQLFRRCVCLDGATSAPRITLGEVLGSMTSVGPAPTPDCANLVPFRDNVSCCVMSVGSCQDGIGLAGIEPAT